LAAMKEAPDKVVASPNYTSLTVTPANYTTSLEMKASIAPLPY